jgi:hypothetical protein
MESPRECTRILGLERCRVERVGLRRLIGVDCQSMPPSHAAVRHGVRWRLAQSLVTICLARDSSAAFAWSMTLLAVPCSHTKSTEGTGAADWTCARTRAATSGTILLARLEDANLGPLAAAVRDGEVQTALIGNEQ